MWYFIHSGLLDIQKRANEVAPELVDSVSYLLNLGFEHKRFDIGRNRSKFNSNSETFCRALIYDVEQLAEVDGYSTWREKESNDLSNLVQERFRYLQNPENCNTAKKLLCNLNKVRQKKYYLFLAISHINKSVILIKDSNFFVISIKQFYYFF